MRKHKNIRRAASLAAPLAVGLAMAAPAAFGADSMETYWAAPPNQSAWVTNYGECWQGVGGEANLPPCGVAEVHAPVVLRLLFELDKYRLENIRNPEALAELDAFIADIKESPRSEQIAVIGHTDKLGSFEHNLVLSENRAATIRDYMVNKGVPPSDIATIEGKAWEGGDDIAADGSVIDLGPLENNPLRRRTVVSEIPQVQTR